MPIPNLSPGARIHHWKVVSGWPARDGAMPVPPNQNCCHRGFVVGRPDIMRLSAWAVGLRPSAARVARKKSAVTRAF